jgi:hypothetical protein
MQNSKNLKRITFLTLLSGMSKKQNWQ